MKRSPLACLLLAGISTAALADDLHVTSVLTSPVATSRAANGTPGNISIDLGAGVNVNTAGAAVTLDSNNSIDNLGTIQNTAESGAIALHVVGGFTGTFIHEGQPTSIIGVSGKGAGNTVLLLDGSAPFTGDITLGISSSLFGNGVNVAGVAIKAPLNGNLQNGAFSVLNGEGATGMLILAPISGSLSTTLGITVGGTDTFTIDKIDPLSGSAIAVAANIGGGILNAGPIVSGDLTTSSSISSSGTAPTVAIQPSIAGVNASNITIGVLADTTNPNRSFINRGAIRATENDPGISTIGVAIGESGAAAHTVTLTGGIFTSGSITSTSSTANTFATSAPAASADTTALMIGNGAIINAGGLASEALLNNGAMIATLSGTKPGTATAVLIQPGGSLPSFTNAGATSAIASTSDTTVSSIAAYGVRDLSGTLRTFVNTGRLTAQTNVLDNNAQIQIAVDLSHGSASQTFTNTGTVIGDVVFGSAGMNGGIAGNQFFIRSANATVQGNVRAAPGGTIDLHIADDNTGGAFRTSDARLTSMTVGSGGTVELALNKNSLSAPVITATGPITFGTGSKVSLIPSTFLPNTGTYTLIHSDGPLQFADFSAATAQPIPFIFNGSITHDANNLRLSLTRKTAGELGLQGNVATIYEPLAAAALTDNEFGAALLTLNSAAEVQAVVSASVPDVAGGVRALSIAMTDQATGVVAARARSLLTAPRDTRNEFRFWGQEFYNNVSSSGTETVPGFYGAGQGVALGVEWGNLATGRYGVGYTYFSSEETESHPRDTKTNGDWNLISLYGAWRPGDFFVMPQANLAQGSFISRRHLVANNIDRSLTASWNGYLAAGGVSAGYVLNLAGFQVMPQVAIDGLYLREGAYNEFGGGGIGLSLKEQSQKSVRSFAGVLGQGTYNWDGANFQPQLLVGWSHEFLNSPATIDGTFESTPGSPFHLVGPTLDANKVIGGASFAYVVGNWSAGISYDAAHSSGSLAQSATVNLSSRF